jgi:hypothetical protein
MRFVKIKDVVDLPLLGNQDFLKRAKGRLLKWSPHVYEDLNLQTLRQAIRQEFKINKRTNTVDLPCGETELSSVSVMDKHGVIYPLYLNDRIHKDIVEIPADKDCNCEYNCGFQLCNTIKGYEAITEIKNDTLPNGSPISFTCVSKKAIDRNGFLYETVQYPMHVFTDGVWTNTVLQTDNNILCKCEVDNNGCLCDTEENLNNVCNACGINNVINQIPVGGNAECPPSKNINEWIYYCNSKFELFSVQCGQTSFLRGCDNIYNISELGNRLIFPHHFHFDKVLVRWYGTPTLKNMQIPFIAVDTFVSGIKWFDVRWDDKRQNLEQKYGADYSKLKWGLFQTLNKYTLSEVGQMLAPQKRIPSYIVNRHNWINNFTNWNNW